MEVTPKFNRRAKATQGKPSHKNDTATLQCKSLAKYLVTSLKSNQDSLRNQLQATFPGIWGFCGVWGYNFGFVFFFKLTELWKISATASKCEKPKSSCEHLWMKAAKAATCLWQMHWKTLKGSPIKPKSWTYKIWQNLEKTNYRLGE